MSQLLIAIERRKSVTSLASLASVLEPYEPGKSCGLEQQCEPENDLGKHSDHKKRLKNAT